MSHKQPKSGGGKLYDRFLVSRLRDYGQNHQYDDLDECVQYLRHNYKEYQRQKVQPFKNQVARAIEVICRRGGPEGVELRLQVSGGACWSWAMSRLLMPG
jgi:hypothetical protein